MQPASAAVLHPRPLAPPPAPIPEDDLDLPKPPDDIERWLARGGDDSGEPS